MKNSKILVLDDEAAIGDMVEIILRKEGFKNIDVYHTYREAQENLMNIYDFYILDIMLPDGSGLDLAKEIRKNCTAPIFFLTAKSTEADILRGFMNGADDYITKPFNPMELAARVKVQIRRYTASLSTSNPTFNFGRFHLDEKAATLTVDGETTPISGKQFHLLHLFCQYPNQVLSKEQLYETVWGFDNVVDDNTIMVHIRRLREKIEVNPSRPEFLQTVRGIGYKLQVRKDA